MTKPLMIHNVDEQSIEKLKKAALTASSIRGKKISQRIMIEEAIDLVAEKINKEADGGKGSE